MAQMVLSGLPESSPRRRSRVSVLVARPVTPPTTDSMPEVRSETAEERVIRFESLVRLLANHLKKRLPVSIDREDLRQAGRMAVWISGDLSKTAMRRRIWCSMIDSVRGKEYREATRVSSLTSAGQYADPSDSIERKLILCEEQDAAAARLQMLNGRERRVLGYRLAGHTQMVTARRMRVTQQRVSQLQRQGLERLHKMALERLHKMAA